jgi:hypothetical protein
MLFQSTIVAALLSMVTIAQPTANDHANFIVEHYASDLFPHSKGNLSAWDVSVELIGDKSSMRSWLTSIDPTVGDSDEQRAEMLLEAAYAKPFDQDDLDMTSDRESILAIVTGNDIPSLGKRAEVTYRTATTHAVAWSVCSGAMSCISGYSCSFSIDVGKAPRSKCQSQGGQNCCVSWSTYNVRAGFFQRTWTNCNQEVHDENMSKASCEGHGSSSQGGDVCLSNRATGCT